MNWQDCAVIAAASPSRSGVRVSPPIVQSKTGTLGRPRNVGDSAPVLAELSESDLRAAVAAGGFLEVPRRPAIHNNVAIVATERFSIALHRAKYHEPFEPEFIGDRWFAYVPLTAAQDFMSAAAAKLTTFAEEQISSILRLRVGFRAAQLAEEALAECGYVAASGSPARLRMYAAYLVLFRTTAPQRHITLLELASVDLALSKTDLEAAADRACEALGRDRPWGGVIFDDVSRTDTPVVREEELAYR